MKKFKLLLVGMTLLICMPLALAISGCGNTSDDNKGVYYDAIDTEEEYAALKEQIKAELKAEMAAEAAEQERLQATESTNVEAKIDAEIDDDEITLDDIDKEDIKYKIFSNDIVTSAISKGELAKTGDPEIDAFLQRFYDKVMDGDTYIQFMLDLAEASGVDINVIDELIDYNASRKIGVWTEELERLLEERLPKEESQEE